MSIGMRLAPTSSFSSARASGSPSSMSRAPVRSASNSRLRVSAICRRPAASGARMARASRAMGLLPSSSRLPPKMAAKRAKVAMAVMPMATAAATDPMRMSRLPTWLISWASTPRSSFQSRMRRMPWVTATAAWSGLRPVAKALGCSSGVT